MERQTAVRAADACLTAWLKEADKASVRKKMAEIGLKVADQLGDKNRWYVMRRSMLNIK